MKVSLLSLFFLGVCLQRLRGDDLVTELVVQKVFEGRSKGTSWFHPRGCMIPSAAGPIAFMSLQEITGSDHYGPVCWMESRDLGRTWSEPRPIPGWQRRRLADGTEEGVCDVVPEYHGATNTILALGHNVFYKDNRFFSDQPPRAVVYCVRDAQGKWAEPKRLVWDDPRGKVIYTCGCAQRVTLDNGEVLVPLSFGGEKKQPRAVATALCSFDGTTLAIKKVSNELTLKTGRGFLEPSLARLDGKFYLTIRAEDGHGYVSTSDDGLTWSPPVPWQWDNGTDITMSTTQQRWLMHADALYLVYTRKDASNTSVFRWRAPLFMARVDCKTLRLLRATEAIAVPLVGDGRTGGQKIANLGNFHTQMVSPSESWVTVGEVIPASFRGDLLLTRVQWAKKNSLALK